MGSKPIVTKRKRADKESPALQDGINNSKSEIVHQLLLEASVILLVLAQANK